MVPRDSLLTWFAGLSGEPLVCVCAPAGYGKTTLLRQWAAADDRPVAWLTLDDGDNDPALLLGYLTAALADAVALDPAVLSGPLSEAVYFDRVALPRFVRSVRASRTPVLLILDEISEVETGSAWRVLGQLIANLPPGSAAVLSGRSDAPESLLPPESVARIVRVRQDDLAFSPAEGSALLAGLDVRLPPAETAQLLTRTEGWPAALYLAGLSLRGQAEPGAVAARFSGSSGVLLDYLRDEFLRNSSPELVQFLTRTSLLDRLSGPICDTVADTRGSDKLLIQISRANLLLSPLDADGTWFRYHTLFAEMLRAELHRLEPELVPTLHARASLWLEAHGDASAAVAHALAGDDPRRAAELVWAQLPHRISTGRRATVERWLDAFDRHDVVSDPLLSLARGWCALSSGDAVEPWIATAELALDRGARPTAKGMAAPAAVAMLRALLGEHGAVRMAVDAERAHALDASDSAGRVITCFLAGVAHQLVGDLPRAAGWFTYGRTLGQRHYVPTPWASCAAQLGVLSALEGNWARADELVSEATDLVRTYQVQDFATMAPVFAASALSLAHSRRPNEARTAAEHATRLLEAAGHLGPWMTVLVRGVLARVSLALGDPEGAHASLADAENRLRHTPDAGDMRRYLDEVRAVSRPPHTAGRGSNGRRGDPVLTAAEQRVIAQLSTHLSFAQIADELLVSKNTVKTQAISAYRKLGVNARSAAVARARELGLID